MRVFNTSGPCDPAKHYTVMREALVAEGQKLIDQGRYFTIFSPRQAGKTTYSNFCFGNWNRKAICQFGLASKD